MSKYLIDFAFNELKMERIMLNVSFSNISAIRCYEKVGFKLVEKKEKKNEYLLYELLC